MAVEESERMAEIKDCRSSIKSDVLPSLRVGNSSTACLFGKFILTVKFEWRKSPVFLRGEEAEEFFFLMVTVTYSTAL